MTQDHELADPAYHRELGGGLLLRWSQPEDTESIARLIGQVFRENAGDPPNERMMERTRLQMRGDSPIMGPNDYAVVEDTVLANRPIVACACLWHHTWEFDGIPFGVGRPEYVGVEPAYRHRGLIRSIFELLHARSATAGHLLQAISGIPYFYRQFGYEYALEHRGGRVVSLTNIPPAPDDEAEPFHLRDATAEDIPLMMQLYAQRPGETLIRTVISADDRRYQIVGLADISIAAKTDALMMICDSNGTARGYVHAYAKRWGANLGVVEVEVAPDVPLWTALPSLLRALQSYGAKVPNAAENKEPFRGIALHLGPTHPIYTLLGDRAASTDSPDAWYIRIADVPGFITHVRPVLEERLAQSALAGYDGELTIDMYRGGLRLSFARGKLTAAQPWEPPLYGDNANAGFPPLVFLQLLLGYRSLRELSAAFPDVSAKEEARILLNVLFPKRPSLVLS